MDVEPIVIWKMDENGLFHQNLVAHPIHSQSLIYKWMLNQSFIWKMDCFTIPRCAECMDYLPTWIKGEKWPSGSPPSESYTMHGIVTIIYHKKSTSHVGAYTSPVDPKSIVCSLHSLTWNLMAIHLFVVGYQFLMMNQFFTKRKWSKFTISNHSKLLVLGTRYMLLWVYCFTFTWCSLG